MVTTWRNPRGIKLNELSQRKADNHMTLCLHMESKTATTKKSNSQKQRRIELLGDGVGEIGRIRERGTTFTHKMNEVRASNILSK